MVLTNQVLQAEEFEVVHPLDKKLFQANQGTTWYITNGILHGEPSPKEYQESKKDHKGLEPRLILPLAKGNYCLQFSMRLVSGQMVGAVPFLDFGHHVSRVAWTTNGASLLVNHEEDTLTNLSSFKIVTNRWYHCQAEVFGSELLVHFEGMGTLYANYEKMKDEAKTFGLGGLKGGVIELDHLKLYSVMSNYQATWRH